MIASTRMAPLVWLGGAALLAGAAFAAPLQDDDGTQDDHPAPEIVDNEMPSLLDGVPETMNRAEAQEALDRALSFLVETQNSDGSWGSGSLEGLLEYGFAPETYYAWQTASHGLALMALLRADETPAIRTALERGIDWFCTTRTPGRGNHWDVDYSWSALYCFVAATRLAGDPRFADGEDAARIAERGRVFWEILARNEVPTGGWAYYDDPPFTRRPTWATSFCSALVLPALQRGFELGWIEDERHVSRCLATVARARLPNGAYTYNASDGVQRQGAGESINNVKGSLGRIQVCNWARRTMGDERVTLDDLREGLEQFFLYHRFLDAAYLRPIPHEAYYANAGYFYLFAHYYAAEVIDLLPAEEQEAYHARLRPHLVKTQRPDGSFCDFLGTSYTVTAGTAYSALGLQLGLGISE